MTLHTATEADALASSAEKLVQQVRRLIDLSSADPTPKNKAAARAAFEEWARLASVPGLAAADPNDPLEHLRTGGLTLDAFLRVQLPPREFLVPGLIEKDASHIFVAAPNVGKTFLAIDVAMDAGARGLRVSFYEWEGSAGGLQRRMHRAERSHELGHLQANLRAFHNPRLTLADDDGAYELIKQLKDHGAQMFVIDSIAAATVGLDENDPPAMQAFASRFKAIMAESKSTGLGLHHLVKEAWRAGEIPTLRHLRGHGSLAGAVDVSYALTASESGPEEVAFDLHDLKQREDAKRRPRRCTVAMKGEAAIFSIEEVAPETSNAKPASAHIAANADALLARLFDCVAHLKVAGPVSKFSLRPHHDAIGCAKNAVDALVDRALLAKVPVLTVLRRDSRERILDLGLGVRPVGAPVRATPGDVPDLRSA